MRHVTRTIRAHRLNNYSGFSLIEIMVVTLISSIVALGSGAYIAQVLRDKKNTDVRGEIATVKSQMEGSLRNRSIAANNIMSFENCFNRSAEAKAMSAVGVPVVLNLGAGMSYKTNQTVSIGNIQYLIEELSFADASKIFSDTQSTAYYGAVYMSAKNLTTKQSGRKSLLAQLYITVAPSPAGNCSAQIEGINSESFENSEESTCGALANHSGAIPCRADPPVDPNVRRCINENGSPVFVQNKATPGETEFYCIRPMTIQCLNRMSGSSINQNRVFRGIDFPDLGTSAGLPSCDRTYTKSRVITTTLYPAQTTPNVATNNNSYTTLAKSSCDEMVTAKTSPNLNCSSPSSTGTMAQVAVDTSVAASSIPTTSPSEPATYGGTSPCVCGKNPVTGVVSTVNHNEFCGTYFKGSLGLNEDVTASSVFRCGNGSLQVVFKAGVPAVVTPPETLDPLDRIGYPRPLNGVCAGGSCHFEIR